jgi:hypothetical protein
LALGEPNFAVSIAPMAQRFRLSVTLDRALGSWQAIKRGYQKLSAALTTLTPSESNE